MPAPNALIIPPTDKVKERAFLELQFDMPPEELKEHVAHLIAIGLYRARLPWLPGEKIREADLKGVATFVIGGLLGLQKAEKDGAQN